MELVLTQPPYNAWHGVGHSGANYDRRTPDDIAEMAILCRRAIKPGTHKNIFGSDVQFSDSILTLQGAKNRN